MIGLINHGKMVTTDDINYYDYTLNDDWRVFIMMSDYGLLMAVNDGRWLSIMVAVH